MKIHVHPMTWSACHVLGSGNIDANDTDMVFALCGGGEYSLLYSNHVEEPFAHIL